MRGNAFDHGGGLDLLETAERLLGTEACNRIWARWSGSTFYCPSRPSFNHPLTKLVGMRGAAKLADAIGGIAFTLPLFPDFGTMGRRELVLVRTIAGASLGEIAREAGCTSRTVSLIRAELRANGELPPSIKDLLRSRRKDT